MEQDDDDDDDDKTIDQNEIKKWNDYFDKIIDKSKSFEDQIKYKCFKIKLADISNEIDKKLFEKIFSHTLSKISR